MSLKPDFSRRRTVLAALALPWLSPLAHAQDTKKTVRLIVSFPPGSGADTSARIYAKRLQELMGQPFVVENKPGANSFIAAQAVATAAPDGTTLFYASNSPVVVNAVLFANLPYKPIADFAPVARATRATNLLLVPAASPYKTLADLIAAGKRAPSKLTYASGSASYQIATEEFAEIAGVQFTHVPYKGSAPAIQDTAAGVVDFTLADLTAGLGLVRGGKLRALAVTSDRRHAALPDVPTAIESGITGFEFYNWTGVFAPARTPSAILEKLEQAVQKVNTEPEVIAAITQVGGEMFPGSSQELRTYQAAQIEKWKRIAQRAGVKQE